MGIPAYCIERKKYFKAEGLDVLWILLRLLYALAEDDRMLIK